MSKIGRNKEKCKQYRAEGKREKNKAREAVKRAKKEDYFKKRKKEKENSGEDT